MPAVCNAKYTQNSKKAVQADDFFQKDAFNENTPKIVKLVEVTGLAPVYRRKTI